MQAKAKYGLYAIAFILVVLVCRCAGNRIQKMNILFDRSWKLVELNGKRITDSGERHPYAVFNKSDNRVYGSGGCNRFSGTYMVSGQKITVSDVISTKMACMEVDYENDFFRILESSGEYAVSGDSLLLKSNGIITARFIYSDSLSVPQNPK